LDRDFSVRPYAQGDEEEIVQLLTLVFGRWPHFDIPCHPLEHWRWKYLSNPVGRVITVAESMEGMIGCFHEPLLNVKIGDRFFLCSQGADQAVHPGYRRLGAYTQMRELAKRIRLDMGVGFHFSGSVEPIMIRGSIKRGEFKFPHPGRVFIRIHDLGLHLHTMPSHNTLLNRYGFYGVRLLNMLLNAIKPSEPLDHSLTVHEIKSFDERVDAFWDDIKEHYVFIVRRTTDYLNWRYCDTRGGGFIVKVVEENDRILGYSVLRVNRSSEGYPVGWIVDLLALPRRLDALHAMVVDAVNHFDKNGLNISICLILKGHLLGKVVARHGYLNSRRGPFMVYVPSYENSEMAKFDKSRVDEVHNVYGDYDWI
jgi:hypothetical protein